jgi:hypothetical protein
MIITNPNPSNFENSVNKIIQDINEWLNTNSLSLNLDKTHFTQFVTKNSSSVAFNIMYGNNKIANVYNTKFLGLTLENTLSWKTHTIIPKFKFSIESSQAILVPGFTENDILFLFSFHHDLRINILGEFSL